MSPDVAQHNNRLWNAENDCLIVVPLDMSEFSTKALRVAARMVSDHSKLRIIYVLPSLETCSPGIAWSATDDHLRVEETRVGLEQFIKQEGFDDLDICIRIGDPATQITMYAEDIGAGLIVIPSHSRGMLARMLLGSTTDRVVHMAGCPVLVLKQKH